MNQNKFVKIKCLVSYKTNFITLRRRGGGNYQQGGQSTGEKTRPFRENSDAT